MTIKKCILVLTGLVMGTLGAEEQFFAVLCKTRDKQAVYAAKSKGCSKEQQADACDTDSGVADATDCKTFKTEDEQSKFLAKNPKRSALTCKVKATGGLFRASAADCGAKAKNFECDPTSTEQLECKDFGNDEKGLDEYLSAGLIGAQVSCRLTNGQTIDLPAPDCSAASQASACQKSAGFKGEPVGCKPFGG